jgi:hypothetical protein
LQALEGALKAGEQCITIFPNLSPKTQALVLKALILKNVRFTTLI